MARFGLDGFVDRRGLNPVQNLEENPAPQEVQGGPSDGLLKWRASVLELGEPSFILGALCGSHVF